MTRASLLRSRETYRSDSASRVLMTAPSTLPRLVDMIEAIDRIRDVTADVSLESFEASWQMQWLVERGIEIISEASRHLTDELKTRHPEIPWPKVASISNVLRHDYERIAPDVLWRLVRHDLPLLEQVCRAELVAAQKNWQQ